VDFGDAFLSVGISIADFSIDIGWLPMTMLDSYSNVSKQTAQQGNGRGCRL
jgi:hypothetical protein